MSTTTLPATEWRIDPGHSHVQFKVRHLVIASVVGHFRTFEGRLLQAGEQFEAARISFALDVASLDTANAVRDQHLRGEDFFDAPRFPRISFESTAFTATGPATYELAGRLTIRDVTRPLTLAVTHGGTTTFRGQTRAGFELRGQFRRQDFGLHLHLLNETGDLVIGDDVQLRLSVELLRQEGPPES
jgi:polyisoprenoid-binding protein YceI